MSDGMDYSSSGYYNGGGAYYDGGPASSRTGTNGGRGRGGGSSRRPSQQYHRRPYHQHPTYSREAGGGPQWTNQNANNGHNDEPMMDEARAGYYRREEKRANRRGQPRTQGPVRSQRRGGTVYYHYGGEGESSDTSWRDDTELEPQTEISENFPPQFSFAEGSNPTVSKQVNTSTGLAPVEPEFVFRIKNPKPIPAEPESRREALIEQLTNCTYECMVCCGKIYQRQAIWSCLVCFNVFHLTCIKKWVDSSAVG